jgi:hypothetical protein
MLTTQTLASPICPEALCNTSMAERSGNPSRPALRPTAPR